MITYNCFEHHFKLDSNDSEKFKSNFVDNDSKMHCQSTICSCIRVLCAHKLNQFSIHYHSMLSTTLEYNEQMFRFLLFFFSSLFSNISGFHWEVIYMLCAYCASKAINIYSAIFFGIHFSFFFDLN